ncbi:MAG: TRAP transporter large permease subunit [Burkholderiaceae bacterium]
MIKRQGFRPEFAGAVEAAASSGGQIMPPVMGAAAFLMAQLTGIVPDHLRGGLAAGADLLRLVVLCRVHRGQAPGHRGLTPEEMPKITAHDWVQALMFIGPILTIVFVMAMGRSPAAAGFWATMAGVVLGFLNKDVRSRPIVLLDALARGGVNCAKILVAVGAIGIVIAGLNLTGLGLGFAQAVLSSPAIRCSWACC